jgi:hypothetical protein
MAGIKIHQYPLERTSFGDEDFYDIDYWDGTGYQSAKVKGSTLKSALGYSFIDIAQMISGYALAPTDAGKVITNSNTAVIRPLVINNTLSGVGNSFHIKGRVALQPLTGVNIDLPDGTTITEPLQYPCVADTHYILHRKASTGNDWVLSAINSETLSNLGSKDLAQLDLIREYEVFEDGTLKFVTNDAGNSAKLQIGENSAERFGEIELNSEVFNQTVAIQDEENNGAGVIVRVNPNEFDIDSRSDITNPATRRNRLYFSPDETILEHFEGGSLVFSRDLLGGNTFTDFNEEKQGLKYADDYSADFVDRSLVDKGYVDASSKNIGNTNLSIPSATNRTLTIPSDSDLTFVNSLRLKTTGNQSLTQFAQNFNTSVDDAEMVNNSIAPLLDNTTLDLFWKYKNNMGVVSDLFAKVDKSKVYGGTRYTLIKANGTQEYYDNLTEVRSNWVDGDTLHQFADETDITYVNNAGGVMFDIPSITWVGNGFKTKVFSVAINSTAFNVGSPKTATLLGVNLSSEGVNISNTLRVQGVLYMDFASFVRIQISDSKSSSVALSVTGTSYGGNVIPEGNAITATNPPRGIGGGGSVIGLNTSGFVTGNATNFFSGKTNYPCATNFRSSYCDFGDLAIGGGKIFDFCEIRSTRNNNGGGFDNFTARNCTIIHTPSSNTHTFWNIPVLNLINCTFISTGKLATTFGGESLIDGGYYSFGAQTELIAMNYNSVVNIRNCTIEATNANASTDCLMFTNGNATNIKINNVTFINPNGRSDIRTMPANNVEWKNCRFSKGNSHISVSSGTVADAINNNPARLTDPKGFLNNTGNGNWFMYVPMTTAERDALTNVSAGFQIINTTTNFLQVYNGSTWKDLLDLT